jgi:hypothetical protein
MSLTPVANLLPVPFIPVSTLVKLVAKFAAGVFATGVVDTGGQP